MTDIGTMAREFGVTARTLRFYEERKFLAPRRVNGERVYGAADRKRLRMILDAKRLGFTLAEIDGIIKSGGPEQLPHERCAAQIKYLEEQRSDIDAAIKSLRARQ